MMKIFATAFLALVFWIVWGVASIKFGAADAASSSLQILVGQHAVIQKAAVQQVIVEVSLKAK